MKLYLFSLLIVSITIGNIQSYAQERQYKTKAELEKEEFERLKILNHRITISLQYGHFGLLSSAIANDNSSNINISDHNKLFNVVAEYYFYEDIAAQLQIGLNVIPQEQRVDSITFTPGSGLGGIEAKGSGKGGAILPVTLGIKKTFLNGLLRPYVSLNSGFTFIKLGTGTGTGSINGIEKNIDYQSKFVFCYQLGTGIQLRVGKLVRFDLGINYYGSPKFTPPIGGIDTYQGFYAFGGINLILNPNKK